MSCAVALANLDVMEREDLPGRVLELEAEFRRTLETLTDLPIVAEVRGMGYFYGIELTKNGADFTPTSASGSSAASSRSACSSWGSSAAPTTVAIR